jgi:hypothetical protein
MDIGQEQDRAGMPQLFSNIAIGLHLAWRLPGYRNSPEQMSNITFIAVAK